MSGLRRLTKSANLSEIRNKSLNYTVLTDGRNMAHGEGKEMIGGCREDGGKREIRREKGGVHNSQSNFFIRNVAQLDTVKSHNFDRDLRA